MSRYQIDIDDDALQEQIQGILNTILNEQLHSRYHGAGGEISSAVKDLIYTRKDEIIEMVVDRASREIVKKGLPKLIERFNSDE